MAARNCLPTTTPEYPNPCQRRGRCATGRGSACNGHGRCLSVCLWVGLFLLTGLSAPAQVTLAGTQIQIANGFLASPAGVAVDGTGTIYIADTNNNRILSVPNVNGQFGTPSVILGGLTGPKGITSDWSGNLYISDTGNNQIISLPATSVGHGAPITIVSGLSSPTGLAVDPLGNVYVADSGNNRVVQLPRIGDSYGSPIPISVGLSSPMGIAVDQSMTLYIADTGNNRILKEALSPGGYTTQQVIRRGLNAPSGIFVDSNGNVFIADTGNSRVLEEPWFPFAKRYKAEVSIGSSYSAPSALVTDYKGAVYVADPALNQVLEIVNGSVEFGTYPVGTSTALQTYSFNIAAGTTIGGYAVYTEGATGRDFVDSGNSSCSAETYSIPSTCGINVTFTPLASGVRMGAVVLYDAQGKGLATAFLEGTGLGARTAFVPGTQTLIGNHLSGPSGVAVDGSGNVYIADSGNNRIVEVPWTASGFGQQIAIETSGLSNPIGLAINGAGDLFIASNGNDKAVRLPWTGNSFGTQQKLSTALYGPSDIAIDGWGNLFITDTLDNAIWKMPWTGNSFGAQQPLGNYHKNPIGVAVDGLGNLYSTSPYQSQLTLVPWSGSQYLPQLPMAIPSLGFPTALGVDGDNNLYVLDTGNNQLVMLPWTGKEFGPQVTVAKGFNAPQGMTIDSNGNIYVADTGNNQVVKIDLSAPSGMAFTDTYLGIKSSDSPKAMIVENIGNQLMTLTSLVYPADFVEDSGSATPCAVGVELAAGGACQVSVDFVPNAASAILSEVATLETDATGGGVGPQALSLNGQSIDKLTQSITFDPISSAIYGANNLQLFARSSSGLDVTYQVISGPATLSADGRYLRLNGAGSVVVEAFQGGNAVYAAATPVLMSINVSPALLHVNPINVTSTYGASLSSFGYSLSGFVQGDSAAQSVLGSAEVQILGGGSNVGSYVLSASMGTLQSANYLFTFGTGILTINPAQLVVQAGVSSFIYGSPPSALPWSVSGFVNGDDVGIMKGEPTCTPAMQLLNKVGNYLVIPQLGTLLAANYRFVFRTGTVQVLPATLTIVADGQTMVYGAAMPVLTYSVKGLVQGDTLASVASGSPTLTTAATSSSNVGGYVIKVSTVGLSVSNYVIAACDGVLYVTKASLTVLPEDMTIVYGAVLPAFKYSLVGFVHSDTSAQVVTGAPVLSVAAQAPMSVGNVTIHAAIGSLSSRNYSFAFSTGNLTIAKATLDVVPLDVKVVYGQDIPPLDYVIKGFVNGDSISSVSGVATISSPIIRGSPAGTYVLFPNVADLSASNYAFVGRSGTLTVVKASLSVTPDAVTMTYGSLVPALTYQISGFVNGDDVSTVNGVASVTSSVSSTSGVGSYVVMSSLGTLSSPNYSFVFDPGVVRVEKAVLTVIPIPAMMTYGSPMPEVKYQLSGFVNGDSAQCVSGAPKFRPSFPVRSGAGVYLIESTPGSLSSSNYTFVLNPGRLQVTKAHLTVTSVAAAITYGSAVAGLRYVVKGFVNGDSEQDLNGRAVVSTAVSSNSPVGKYAIAIGAGSLWSPNYDFSFETNVLTVKAAIVVASPVAVTIVYGQGVPAFRYSYTGLVNGDSAQVIKGVPVAVTDASSVSPAGVYPVGVTIDNVSAENYIVKVAPGVLVIRKAVVTVKVKDTVMTYGDPAPRVSYTLTGLVNGDTVSVVSGGVKVRQDVALMSQPGSYVVDLDISGFKASNYSFVGESGVLTVAKAVLTVEADSQVMTYGSAMPALTYSIKGFVMGDLPERSLAGFPEVRASAGSGAVVGMYVIAPSAGSLSSKNYDFRFKTAGLRVEPAVLTLTAESVTKRAGGVMPVLTYHVAGLMNDESVKVATTGAVTVSTEAKESSSVGSYRILLSRGSLSAKNYSIRCVSGTLTVTQ